MTDQLGAIRINGVGDGSNIEVDERYKDMKDGTHAKVLYAIAGLDPRDSAAIDAFTRLRVSNPENLFDSKNIFDDPDLAADVDNQPLFFDNQETAGSGTSTLHLPNQSSQRLSVGASTAGTRVRQTKMRFNYQPGKSQLVFLTFNMLGGNSGITKRYGYFDEKNGLFLELAGSTVSLIKRSYSSGAVVDTFYNQADWNLDAMDGEGRSGIELDFSKAQIMIIDFEWLGVGRVRFGFLVEGLVHYVHQVLHANIGDTAYMQTPNLPVRAEISNDGSGDSDSLDCICSSAISEGGSHDLGVTRYASTAGAHVDADVENTVYAVLGIRLKQNYLGMTIKLLNIALQIHTAAHQLEWIVLFNPTVAGAFNYADVPRSAVQVARGALANTVTGGFGIEGGFVESGGNASGAAGSAAEEINNVLRLGSLIDGTPDTMVLCVRPIAGSTGVDVEGAMSWRESS